MTIKKSKLISLKSIKIKGLTWKIQQEKNLCINQDAFALVRPKEQTIFYDPELEDDRVLNSIFHEAVEVICLECDFKFDHYIIQILANEFYSFLTENKLLKEVDVGTDVKRKSKTKDRHTNQD